MLAEFVLRIITQMPDLQQECDLKKQAGAGLGGIKELGFRACECDAKEREYDLVMAKTR